VVWLAMARPSDRLWIDSHCFFYEFNCLAEIYEVNLSEPIACKWFQFVLHYSILAILVILCMLVVISPGSDFVFSVLVKRFSGKSISEMTYIVSSGI